MPPVEELGLTQTAVLWPRAGTGAYGEATFGPPREVRVRWDDSLAGGTAPAAGGVRHDATVVAGEDVGEGSLLWRGRLRDWRGQGDLLEVTAAAVGYDLKGRFASRRYGLTRYKGKLPA